MSKMLGTIIEMFVYSAIFMIIVLVSVKIVGSVFSTDFEKKIAEEGNVGLAIVCGSMFIGLALLLSSIAR